MMDAHTARPCEDDFVATAAAYLRWTHTHTLRGWDPRERELPSSSALVLVDVPWLLEFREWFVTLKFREFQILRVSLFVGCVLKST